MEVKIHINDPILRCYFIARFPEGEDGRCIVGTRSLIGMSITNLVSHSDRVTISDDDDESIVLIRLTKSKLNDKHRDKALYLTDDAHEQIITTLKKEYDTEFEQFCTVAQSSDLKIKDAIEAFIEHYNLCSVFGGDIDTLKKRNYRFARVARDKMCGKLRKKAEHNARIIREIIKSHAPA